MPETKVSYVVQCIAKREFLEFQNPGGSTSFEFQCKGVHIMLRNQPEDRYTVGTWYAFDVDLDGVPHG